jgi:SAM-dependent methyltransferase
MVNELDYLERRLKDIGKGEIGPISRIYWDYHYRVNMKLAIESTKKGDIILDLGCGTGNYIVALSKDDYVCFGIDPLLETSLYEARRKAKKREANINLIQGVGEALPLPKDFFNIVLCFSTLQHVAHQNKTLFEIKRVLKNDGILLTSVPLYRNIFNLYKNHKKPLYVTKFFSLKDLKLMLTKNDFDIFKIRGCGFFPPFMNACLFILYHLSGEKIIRFFLTFFDVFAKMFPSTASSVIILSRVKK